MGQHSGAGANSGCENAKRSKEELEAILSNDANSTKLLKNVIEKGIKQLELSKKDKLFIAK